MDSNIAILELKYGNIYGGFPNFFAIADITLMVFETRTQKIFVESFVNNIDVDYVSVFSKTNELGHTVERVKEVVNMRTGRTRPFQEDFQLDERDLGYAFRLLRPAQMRIKKFLLKNFHKYRIEHLVTFDGRRDIFLCEKAGIDFRNVYITDLQKDLNKETEYLFSLNKLAVIADFRIQGSFMRSNNLEYWLHPIAAKQIVPKTAAFDAARLLMIHNEYRLHTVDFLLKAQLLLNKLNVASENEKA